MAACTSAAASGHHSSREECVIHRVQASLNSSGLAAAGGGSGGHGDAKERLRRGARQIRLAEERCSRNHVTVEDLSCAALLVMLHQRRHSGVQMRV